MGLFSRIIIGLLGISLGALITIKHDWFIRNFGYIATAERYLGTFGGTRLFYQLLGVVIALISTMFMTGVLQKVLLGVAKTLFGSLGT